MQPYPRSPDLVWLGQLHGTGCLSARALDTAFPTVVWCLCLGLGCGWVWVLVTPPVLAGVLGGCVWVRFMVSSLFCRLGFVVFAVGLGFWPAPHLSWLGIWDVRGCVRVLPAPRRACWGLGFGCAPPLLGGCWGVCVLVCPSRVVSCTSWLGVLWGGVWLVPRPATPGWGVGVCVCLCPRPVCSPPLLAGVCCVGVRVGPGSPLCPALLGGVVGVCFIWGGGVSCFRFVVFVAGCPYPGPCGPCPPIPSLSGWVAGSFFFSFRPSVVCVCAFWVSLLPLGRCSWLGVAGFG